ncbi:tectonin beta-propeller repeat-containing protein isoform X3 [Tribolium castaneum]|uniref:tectonin beta-propeller repeat-containing protein isoform X3 n=1 Tax=Tribolium castaneum TaxID=7070 RepID=UPI00046C33CE|nr:PREDICTED: tectonin beta-propeller repeat-containing protein isoform X3 [Tribolium castaneum]|eukprot:XP_008194152.1 PREDICTED: tectonin beta-propeller repeat-containing protein isoform X3 [Tribolium castaneum]
MPSSLLFGINSEGRVHTLSTTGTMWREIPYAGQEFKKLSAVPHFLWALGGDHQIYVYVHGLDIPIRVREESYENERWLPIEGFSSRLLPTDRYHFSNGDGTVDRSIDKIRLPSMAWQWEGDWQLELTLDGQPLDHQGWTYAVDFPSQYYSKKQWKSCVRRRLWVRSRRYSAMNSWCAIAPLHKDATSEPFIDISIGGQSVAGAEPGTMLVWAVTSHNRVMFRTGVSTKSPEGARWNPIQVPLGSEVNQINVGPTGLVWASLLDGRALVRTGVTRDCLTGDSWVEVRGPGDNLKISQLSVGSCAVWAITQNKQVWFRKGVKGEGAGMSEELAVGCGWVEMVGRMAQISVAANDQVFAVGADDRLVYYRSGVANSDLTGKRWKALHAPLQQSRPSSMCEPSTISEWEDHSHSAPTAPTSLPVGDLTQKFETQPKNPKAWSPVHSVGSIVGTEVHPEVDESVWSDGSRESCIFAEDEELGWAEYEAPWSWVEAGACTVDPTQLPNWFAETGGGASQTEIGEPWRLKILQELKLRLPTEKYKNWQLAVDTTSWVHSGEARVSWGSGQFVDCVLQLEWVQTTGTLTVLNPDGASTMNLFSLNDITCVQCCSEPGSPRLALHVPRHAPSLLRLQFSSDAQLEEWQTHFATTCGKLHQALGKPSEESVWAVTGLGDVFIWDPTQLESNQLRENDYYVQKFDLSGKESPIKVALHGSFNPGTTLTLTGCIGDDADRIGINLDAHSTYKLRHKAYSEFENTCLHFNPRFTDGYIVRNSMIEGKWGKEECEGEMPLQKGHEFTLKIETTEDAFVIYIDDKLFTHYRHRLPPNSVSMLNIWGRLQPFRLVIKCPDIILDPLNLYWRQVGGHLRRVESCRVGVTWGIGYDHTAWVYTGGWGGGFLGPLDSHNVHPMTDSQDYRVYENQRWNPVTGYTSAGLPTDRYMWSDATGKQKRTRDQVKLLSVKWQWVSDWMIDFHVPGGVDRDGWQYAVDFPSTYHAHKNFTDYVRRRRWYRRCAVATTGPWQELGHTKLIDVSLEPVKDDLDSVISVWALASGGQAMFRTGVTRSNPTGTGWEHVTSDQPLASISCGSYNLVWATGKKGCAYWRAGINENKLEGERWVCVEPPNGGQLKQISVNCVGVWGVDHLGRLHVRREVTETFPEGTHWQTITVDPLVLNSAPSTTGFKHVSVGRNEVWATTDGGAMLRRTGICKTNPGGSGWFIGIPGNWQHVSVRAFN